MDQAAAALEPLDRLAVERLRISHVAEERARAGLDAQRPVGTARSGARAQAIERGGARLRRTASGPCLDQLHECPREEPDIVVLAASLCGRERFCVAAVRVVK